jgi:hypothetical protein
MSESETDARTPQAVGLEVADAVVGSAETACGLRDERSGVSWKHARLWANGQASSLALTPSHGFRRVQVWPRLCGIT